MARTDFNRRPDVRLGAQQSEVPRAAATGRALEKGREQGGTGRQSLGAAELGASNQLRLTYTPETVTADGKIIEKIESVFVSPTDYSPIK
jgi:hypothetical protein